MTGSVSCPHTGNAALYLIPADGSETPVPVELYCSDASFGLSSPTWSPDGRAIAFTEHFDDDNLAVIGEEAIKICNLPNPPSSPLNPCTMTTAVERTEADHLGGSDWSNTLGTTSTTTTLAFDWRQVKGWSGRGWSVYTAPLEWDEEQQLWDRKAESVIELLFSGRGQSWSPDDSGIAAYGIFIYNVATLAKRKAAKGSSPDWRGPEPPSS